MKREALTERMELLEIGEKLGYPRLGYGRPTKIPHDRRIKPGKEEWEKFCAHAHVHRILPALRIGRVLRDHNVTVFHPLSGSEVADTQPVTVTVESVAVAGTDLLDDVLPPRPREEWVAPGSVTVYPPGKRRRYPSKKNKAKVT